MICTKIEFEGLALVLLVHLDDDLDEIRDILGCDAFIHLFSQGVLRLYLLIEGDSL